MKKIPELQDLSESFTVTTDQTQEKELLAQQVEELKGQRYSTALVIGRFQPLHRGHVYLMKFALKISDNLIVGIGSSNVENEDNPFSARDRQSVLEKTLEKEHLLNRVKKIVLLADYPDDEEWFKKTMEQTGPVDIVIGNNDWVNKIFELHGIKSFPISFFKRDTYEGRKIREQLRKEGLLQ